MVNGIAKFKEYFKGFENQYVIIFNFTITIRNPAQKKLFLIKTCHLFKKIY